MLSKLFRSKSKLNVEAAASNKKYDKMCMMMDGNNAQNTSSNMPENFSFLENTEERYARLNVMPGSIKRKRKRVDTANATIGSGLAQFPYKIDFFAEPKSLSFTINFFIDVNQLIHQLTAFLYFIGYPMLLFIRS
jgi:hypothetical protein